jgi:hypothetical protein
MSIERLVENKIREAMEKGEFDNLPGRGLPLDLTAYFNTPSDLRLGFAMLKGAQFVPPEVELRRELERLQEQLAQCTDEGRRAALKAEIKGHTLKLNWLTDSQQHAQKRR